MPDLKRVIAHRLRVLRTERDMSQQDLADASGVSVDSICKYERAEVAPQLRNAYKLAEALGCTPNDLCDFPVNDNK